MSLFSLESAMHTDFVRRHLEALEDDFPAAYDTDFESRFSNSVSRARPVIKSLLGRESSGVDRIPLTEANRFVYDAKTLRTVAGFALMTASVLEEVLFSERRRETVRIAIYFGLINAFLDDLLDDLPSKFESEKVEIRERLQLFAPVASKFDPPAAWADHPLLELVWRLVAGVIKLVHTTDVWQKNPEFRDRMRGHIQRALEAEYASVGFHIDGPPGLDPRTYQEKVEAKAVCAMRASGAIPQLTNRPLNGPRHQQFQELIDSYAEFLCWIDDVADYHEDLRDGRWSTVSLEVHRVLSGPGSSQSVTSIQNRLQDAIALESITNHLTDISCRRQSKVIERAKAFERDDLLISLVGDSTRLWLKQGKGP